MASRVNQFSRLIAQILYSILIYNSYKLIPVFPSMLGFVHKVVMGIEPRMK